jgi:plastocyanin
MRNRTTAGVLVCVLVLTLGAAACSSDDNGGSDASSSAAPTGDSSAMTITAEDFAFSPTTLSLPSGESTITVTNTGAVEHSFTLDDDSVSEDVEPGESITVTVDLSADAPFHCKYHPDQMTGTLEVA